MKFISLLLCSISVMTASVVTPDDYLMSTDKEVDYIYPEEYAPLMPNMKAYQKEVMQEYEKEFGFKLDDKMSVGVASSNNQIANAFSTQIPFNMQVFYGAGVGYVDYFSTTSWLKTLVIHETAHNFQLNPKENFVSKTSHKILGNNPISFLGLFPLFAVPNVLENSFVLEGNAVMNESRFGNGGRLFSGYALAEVVAMAKAGVIRPELMYNATLEFPYGEKAYLVGGFFQQFLVEKYGLEKVNGYFKTFSTQPLPFFTSAMFKKQYGKSFKVLLKEFVEALKNKHNGFTPTQGELLARSQIFTPLNRKDNEIYTLIGDRKSAPKVLKFNCQNMTKSLEEGSWRVGELFKINNRYYSEASAQTSPVKITMGLFDSDGFLKKGFEGQVFQGFTQSGKKVYFDVAKSIESPQLYVDGKFYTQSHSSVYIDGEDLYYFKQEGEKRTLYKNKTALFSFEGHYGFVSDVDRAGVVYFIASSKDGSSVYSVKNGQIERVKSSDDIIDFKLLDNHQALVATIDAYGYAYRQIKLNRGEFSTPYKINIPQNALMNSSLRKRDFLTHSKLLEAEDYNAIKELKYSSLGQALSYGSYTGFGIDLQANFADPLLQNSATATFSHNDAREIVGLAYENSAYRLNYGGAIYGVLNHKDNASQRNVGYDVYANLPLMASGYWRADATLAYTKDYDTIYREPLTLSLNILNAKQFGLSKYVNSLNALEIFGSKDREVNMFGGTYHFKHDLVGQSYVGVKASYFKSNSVNSLKEKGIALRDGLSALQSDNASLDIPSFSTTGYAQEVKMAELSLSKVFDGSLYFFSFPLSLQRETLYAKQRIYDIDFSKTLQQTYYESTLGTTFDFLFLNQFSLPMSLEWIHNQEVEEQNQVRVLFGGSF